MQDKKNLIAAVTQCIAEGLNVIPCSDQKRPVGLWAGNHDSPLPETEILSRLYEDRTYGIGIICGKGSGDLEVIDIDHKYDLTGNLVNGYFKLIHDNDPELFNSFFIVKSPSNGYHLYYRSSAVEGNQKLAMRPTTAEERAGNPKELSKVLIETRGLGGFIVCPPTPGYTVWQKNSIPDISIAQRNFLLDGARSFNELYTEYQPVKPIRQYSGISPFEITPWDDYNNRGDIISVLENQGWTVDRQSNNERTYLIRPGKDKGYSSDYHKEKKLFKCWSTSQSDFAVEKAYNHTAVFAILECGGDFSQAAKQLEEMGFGKRITENSGLRTDSAILRPPPVTEGIRIHDTLQPTPVNYFSKFQESILDQARDYPLPVPVISINQENDTIPMLTLKSFSLWQGKQKSKKTTALALAVAAFLKGPSFTTGHFQAGMDGVVLFFDNEQGESYAARTMKLILKLADLQSTTRLIYCDLREFSPAERKKIIRAGVEGTPNVKLIIIDGLVDLLTDFMDAGEGHITTTDILKLCSEFDIHVAGVLHQNKNDKNARAHIGTISSQKCEVEISTEVDPDDRNQSFVICVNSRGLPFEQFAIRWDKGSLPCVNSEWNSTKTVDIKANRNYEKSREVAEAVFKPFAAISYNEAVTMVMNATRKSKSTAKRLIDDFMEWGMIAKGMDGNYRINAEQGSRVHEGSKQVHEPAH